MEKQQLLFEQSRLADRGAAEMVLLYISACRGMFKTHCYIIYQRGGCYCNLIEIIIKLTIFCHSILDSMSFVLDL